MSNAQARSEQNGLGAAIQCAHFKAPITTARAEDPFTSIKDLCRRAEVPVASLTRIAETDGFRPAFGLAHRKALWAITGLA